MTDVIGYAGLVLLAAATVPQAVRLLRTRSAADFGWPFVLLNAAGLAFLAVRSAEIGEVAFVSVNALAFAFWSLAATVKALEGRSEKRKVVADGA